MVFVLTLRSQPMSRPDTILFSRNSMIRILNITRSQLSGCIPFAVALLLGSFFLSSCHHSQPATKRFKFTGRVVSISMQDQSALIDGDNIPGFMEPMAMSYKIKPSTILAQLSPGDLISAELVDIQHDDAATSDYWLENVTVTSHRKEPPAKSSSALHTPAPGEDVPDFSFTNQDANRISFRQYRGKTLLLTFIYTRCPFSDFCPRMSSNFAEIYQQLGTNPALANAQLLSITFDPQHDTPRVLHDYGFSVAHTRDSALFKRWQFAAPSAGDLPKIADFFALTVKPEGGLITHNLSTAVIGPDGKIVQWYHGSDWQVSDLIKDVTASGSQQGVR